MANRYTCAQVFPTESFDLPLADLKANANYRNGGKPGEDPELDSLAQSIRDLGQLQPVLVAASSDGWILAAGFRRVAAAISLGYETVRAVAVDPERVDLVRLAENFDRTDPTSYDTCRYLYELNKGRHGARKRTQGEIAEAVGLSAGHVGNLIRFYRDAPPEMREAWAADRDQRFTFTALNTLTREAKRCGDFTGELEKVLAKPSASAPAMAKPKKNGKPLPRRLGRSGAERLALQLGAVDPEVLQTDERAVIMLEVLGAVAGKVPASQVKDRLDLILGDLGIIQAPPEPTPAPSGLDVTTELH